VCSSDLGRPARVCFKEGMKMKRIFLSIAIVLTLLVGSLATPSTADARPWGYRGGYYGGGGYYGSGYRPYYGYSRYNSYYSYPRYNAYYSYPRYNTYYRGYGYPGYYYGNPGYRYGYGGYGYPGYGYGGFRGGVYVY